jgi:hypothetical protein
MSITITPKYGFDKVDFSTDTDTHLMLEIKGSENGSSRAPLDIIDVIDHSSSMSSANKLAHIKKSLALKINHMSNGDFLTIISYNSYTSLLLPRTEMTAAGKQKALQAVSSLYACGGTDYGQALGALKQELSSNGTTDNFVRRVIWFSDGCPTSGQQDPAILADICKDTPDGWQFTTMGYGVQRDDLMKIGDSQKPSSQSGIDVRFGAMAFNAPTGMSGEVNIGLLTSMAEAGRGNFYYMKDADSASLAFANELGGLLSTVAQNLKIEVTPVKDRVDVKEVLEDLDVEDKNDTLVVTIPDIMAGETKYITMPIVCKKRDSEEAHRAAKIAQIKISYLNPKTGNYESVEVSPKIQWVKSEKKSTDVDPDVKTQLAVLEAIKAQEAAQKMANLGNFADASQIIADSAKVLRSVGTSRGLDLGEKYGQTQAFVADSASYHYSKDIFETSFNELKTARSSGGVYGSSLANKTQMNMAASFKNDWDNVDSPDQSTPDVFVHPTLQSGPIDSALIETVDVKPKKTCRSKTSKVSRY